MPDNLTEEIERAADGGSNAKWDEARDGCDLGDRTIDRIADLEDSPYAPELIYPDATSDEIERIAGIFGARHIDQSSFQLLLSFHSFLVRSENHTILVDLCCGNDKERPDRPTWHRRKGPFLDNLAKAGVKPADVDVVMCTHLHADHVGWNTKLENGAWVPTFPNARYLFAETEYEFWRDEQENSADPILYGSHLDSVLPVMQSGQADLVAGDHQVESGIFLETYAGHTPGNAVIHVEGSGGHAVVCGDVMHHPVQLVHPEWSTNFCNDPEQSRISRTALLDRFAGSSSLILPAHFQAPYYGRIEKDGGVFRMEN